MRPFKSFESKLNFPSSFYLLLFFNKQLQQQLHQDLQQQLHQDHQQQQLHQDHQQQLPFMDLVQVFELFFDFSLPTVP